MYEHCIIGVQGGILRKVHIMRDYCLDDRPEEKWVEIHKLDTKRMEGILETKIPFRLVPSST